MIVDLGDCKVVGPAVKFSSSKNFPRSSPPKLGEHTRDILCNILQYSEDKIDKLYENKIVA